MNNSRPASVRSGIVPLALLTLAGFTFNTSELIPIGLLTDIAASFGITEARAGMLITVYAWVVALMSLPLMLLFARMEFKRLMLWVVGVFFVSHIGSVLSTGYSSLMASRIGVALAHSLFWSIAPAMAVAVMPPARRAAALSALVAGGGIAMIAGLPLGRMLGLVAGWRAAFAALGCLAALIFVGMWWRFPTLERQADIPSRKALAAQIFHCRPLLVIYFTTAVIVTGHYTGYSYIEPFMIQVVKMPAQAITLTLSLFGVAGLLGSAITTKWYQGHPRLLIRAACFAIPCVMMLLLPGSGVSPYLLGALCIVWGIAMTVFNISFQNEILILFPTDSAVPMSLYSGIFNLGIGAGAAVGAMVVDHNLLPYTGLVGGAIAIIAATACTVLYPHGRTQ